MKKRRDRLRRFAYYRGISKADRPTAWPEFREVLNERPEATGFRVEESARESWQGEGPASFLCNLPRSGRLADFFTGSERLWSRAPPVAGAGVKRQRDGARLPFFHEPGADQYPGAGIAGDEPPFGRFQRRRVPRDSGRALRRAE